LVIVSQWSCTGIACFGTNRIVSIRAGFFLVRAKKSIDSPICPLALVHASASALLFVTGGSDYPRHIVRSFSFELAKIMR